MSWRATTMPGVLMDESEADDSARALFLVAETPTRTQVLKSARWLGVTPEALCRNLALDFNSLPDDDATPAEPDLPAAVLATLAAGSAYSITGLPDEADIPPPMTRRDLVWLVIALLLSSAVVGGLAGWLTGRWQAGVLLPGFAS